jgi:nitrite reductase (NADH) small subunit
METPVNHHSIAVCASDALALGECRVFQVASLPIAVARTELGYHAFVDLCPHRAGPLSEGALLSDAHIRCPWHGAEFHLLSGKARCGPTKASLRVFPVRKNDGSLWVDLPVEPAGETSDTERSDPSSL